MEYELATDRIVIHAWPVPARLHVTWTAPETGADPSTRIFHPVPGFQALPLAWELSGDPMAVSIRPV